VVTLRGQRFEKLQPWGWGRARCYPLNENDLIGTSVGDTDDYALSGGERLDAESYRPYCFTRRYLRKDVQ